MKKPWGGRFSERTAHSVETFTESISFDTRLWPHDIAGSIAHAKMLARKKIISRADADAIIAGLQNIAADIRRGAFRFDPSLEDIHMNIERALIKKIGPAGGKLHTARSRNDQVALDLRLYAREETDAVIGLLEQLRKQLLSMAKRHANTIMPGYTHLQRAQPVVFGHHLLAYAEMFSRDIERFAEMRKRINVLPLGACALAGTSLRTDRAYVAKLLGFSSLAENSMDAVSDRDFAIEFTAAAAITMMHMSRMAEELILWSTEEFGFIEIADAYTTGSSIMPQKKNPDVAELIRGKTGRVYGSLVSLLTIMKALPLTYNRDMQEDKIPLFDAVDTLKASLSILIEMYPAITVHGRRMKEAAPAGYATATDLAEYLVAKGMPFRTAHEVVGTIVRHCIENGIQFSDLTTEQFRKFSPLFGPEARSVATIEASVASKTSAGGTAPALVKERIRQLKRRRK